MLQYLQGWLVEEEGKLRKSSDFNEMKEAQGKVAVLHRILELKEELRSYGVKLMKGEAKKVEVPQSGMAKV